MEINKCPSKEGKTCWGFTYGECNMKPENTDHNTCGFCHAYGNYQWDKFEKLFGETNNLSPYGNI
jgi:hypothetical protein